MHARDGIDGTRKRIDTARKHIENFGIASEHGLSRARPPNFVEQSLKVYAEAAKY